MDAQGWERVKKVFHKAVNASPAERRKLLDASCGIDTHVRAEVEALLAAHEKAGTAPGPSTLAVPPDDNRVGEVIGRYKLLQEVGRGGFGVVYMAAQTQPVRRHVALKIIKLGMDTKQVIARFEAERQALALMDHPNIAKVLDGGATAAGRPYFVMELVKGIPITEYCDQAGLDTTERLELFKQVCHAVQHAHQKGIIHRDLKPSNVMVTLHDGQPVPKVIDFGIAKATERHLTEKTVFTEFRQLIGTPEYMAPEQAELSGLDVDTRADIYSLGVLLYELLTGTKPFDMKELMKKGYDEILRTIREVEPQKPSTRLSTLRRGELGTIAQKRHTAPKSLGRTMRGDLDWIVMKALEKDRSRRYETANSFAIDVQRFLADQPVLAGPPSTFYRLRKYVRRHRVAVAAGGCVVASLVAGIVLAASGYVEAKNQRNLAVTASTKAEREAEAANDARLKEEEQRKLAEKSEKDAKRERDAKEEARAELQEALRRSEGIRLSALSQAVLTRNPSLALLLAIEGARREPGVFANKALLESLDAAPERELHLGPEILSVQFNPKGNRLLALYKDGAVRVLDAQTGEPLGDDISPLRQETESVLGASWSLSGRIVVQVGKRGAGTPTIHLLDDTTGEVQSSTKIKPPARWIRVSQDGRYAASTERGGGRSWIWDLEKGKVLHELSHESRRRIPHISRHGSHLLTWTAVPQNDAEYRSRYEMWDMQSGERVQVWETRGAYGRDIHPRGKLIAIGYRNGDAELLNVRTGKITFRLLGHDGRVEQVRFTPDGNRLLTRDERAIRVWDVETGRRVHTLHVKATGRFRVSRNGRRLAVLARGDPQEARIWDLESGTHLYTLRGLGDSPMIQRFSPDGGRLLTGSRGTLRIWDPAPGREELSMQGNCPPSILFPSHDGRHVANVPFGTYDIPPRVWELDGRRPVRVLLAYEGTINGRRGFLQSWAAFSRDGRRIVTAGRLGDIVLWNRATGDRMWTFRELKDYPGRRIDPTWSAEFSPDGRRIVTAGEDGYARVYDADTGKLLFRLGDGRQDVWTHWWAHGRWAAFSPDGTQILTRLDPHKPQIWNAASGELIHDLMGHAGGTRGAVYHAAYSPNGKWIKTSNDGRNGAREDAETRIWNPETGECARVLKGGLGGLGQPFSGFSPDSERIVVAVFREGIRTYEVSSGRLLRSFPIDGGRTVFAFFSPDGRYVMAIRNKGTVHVWESESGKPVLEIGGGVAHVFTAAACFAPDSRSILMIDRQETLRVIPLDLLAAAVARRPRDLTPVERERYEVPRTIEAARSPKSTTTAPRGRNPSIERMVDRLARLPKTEHDLLRQFREMQSKLGVPQDLSWAVGRIAGLLHTEGRLDAAERWVTVALEEAERAHGARHATVDRYRRTKIWILLKNGKAREAESIARRLGQPSKLRVDLRPFLLGKSLLAQNRLDEAEPLLRRSADVFARDNPNAWKEEKGYLGECLYKLGRFEEAESWVLDAYAEAEFATIPKWERPYRTAIVLRRIVAFYEAWKKPEQAIEWKKKLEALAAR